MRRFKVDENLHQDVADLLRTAGHDAMTVVEQGLRGKVDGVISEVCKDEQRILRTLDVDFADVIEYPPREFPGLIVLRLSRQKSPSCVEGRGSSAGEAQN